MEYKLPPLPLPKSISGGQTVYGAHEVRQYAEQAVAPLLAEIERLEAIAMEYDDWIRFADSGEGDFVDFLSKQICKNVVKE